MPAVRPCAAFEPISPDFNLAALVESTPNFEYVTRIHCDMIDEQGVQAFEKLVLLHVVVGGKPLVVEGYDERLERWTFASQWLKDNCGTKVENARDLTAKSFIPLTIAHYLNNMERLASQWTPRNYKESNRQRLYLKDIDCPQVWHDKLKAMLPPGVFYWNDSTGDIGGLGSVMEPDPHGLGMKKGKGIAIAGDLMSSLPPEMRAENIMCYIGHEGTYTPAHREMCASLGQNIMVEASNGRMEQGVKTKPGSSIWFMTESKDRDVVSEYWLSTLGHDIEVEDHYAQVAAWKAAPFKTYIVEQRVGDFILIPPLAPHQVWNRGTRTMKVAWNRTTVETLEMALNEALPRARTVCRDEQYKNKAMIYYSLSKYSALLKSFDSQMRKTRGDGTYRLGKAGQKIRQLQKDFEKLLSLFTHLLLSESFSPNQPEKKVQFLPFESIVTCAYCRCNIVNRFLTCPSCIVELPNGDEDTYDICMDCYAMGRSCACVSKLKWVEQFSWDELTQKHETWRQQVLAFPRKDGDAQPQPLSVARQQLGKKSLAQICQEELKRRPWNDVKKPRQKEKDPEEEEVVEVDDEGRVKKKRKIRRSEKWHREHLPCHICQSRDPTWKLATCTQCSANYCYGSLFRAFDLMPQTVMENLSWTCPKCLKICSCSNCRKDPNVQPFQPTQTILGLDTSKVADPRSVDSLVNFSISNVHWLKKAGDDHLFDTQRIRKRQAQAALAKSQDPTLGEDYAGLDAVEARLTAAMRTEFPLDPRLGSSPEERLNEDGSNERPQFVSPLQVMYNHEIDENVQHGQAEGITYMYPDPDGHLVRLPSPERPTQKDVTTNNGEIVMTGGKKRKKSTQKGKEKPTEDDSINNDPDDQGANTAASRLPNINQSLVVKLPISASKLGKLETAPPKPANPATGEQVDQVQVIQSDLKPVEENTQDSLPHTLRTKVRAKPDDEFKPRKDRRKSGPGTTSRVTTTYVDDSDLSSEDEEEHLSESLNYSSIRNHSRSNSKWLKMRQQSDDELSTGSPAGAGDTAPQSSQGGDSVQQPATLSTRDAIQKQQDAEPQASIPQQEEDAATRAAENRRAKIEAMRWAGEALEGDSHSGSAQEDSSSYSSPSITTPVEPTIENAKSVVHKEVRNAIRPSRGRSGANFGRR